jgi:predicted XRE-type DNA-binding protein
MKNAVKAGKLSGSEVAQASAEILRIKWQVATAIGQELHRQGMSKAEMARRMSTCRMAVDRLLDTNRSSVTLKTLCRAAAVLGRQIKVELV